MKRLCLAALAALMLLTPALQSPAYASDKLTVLLDWYVNPDHGPLIVAQELGYFEAEGLDVELIAPSDPSAPPRLVAAGQGDIAVSYQPTLYEQVQAELPLTRIGTLVETPLNALIALKDGPIKSLKDLKGKKVGFSISGFEDAILSTMLKTVGLTEADVEMINVNFALTPALLSGQVDAVIGAYRNFELTQLEIEGKPGIAIYPEEHGVPVYDELIYIVNSEKLDDDRFKRFLRAVEAATIFLTNHPEQGFAAFIKAHADLDDELNRRAWFDTLPRFAKRPAALDAGRYERFGHFMKDAGLVKTLSPVEDYAVELR
ncbi:ABC transporter substrate-binding protein [Breoghania sp. L-A4]|uniref:ABC transporter substrate-binding protein n=1 Tax=Breoghania sp. L-A4 TaxID=2304600 RepID=UPI000E358CC7|nr:ABC transporter substrate-binding protein [Breoghania sp. L-A4]AXS41768.1 ABC transporter ATP-binding protein [Breoghania sp. L-A4]